MNAKEFLQIEKQVEQMVAFQTLMKGELAKEIKEAKEALKALGEAKDLAKARKELEEDKVFFEKYKDGVAKEIEEADQKLEAKATGLNKNAEELTRKKQDLINFEAELKSKENTLDVAKYNFEQTVTKEQDSIKKARAELDVRLDKFQPRMEALLAREASVEKKLALFKEV